MYYDIYLYIDVLDVDVDNRWRFSGHPNEKYVSYSKH